MKAIQIKYLGPTNTLGTRIKAFTTHQSYTMAYNYDTDVEGNAYEAAQRLVDKMGWSSTIEGYGTLPNGDRVITLTNKWSA
tara:strand:- start:348 stop:590 length:243 start_codon:yes stop_codon:yes gene_type:complete